MEQIFGDNNPLNSCECHEFAKSIGSSIQTSSPEYARSNGLAEKGEHISKRLVEKYANDGTNVIDSVREYNSTLLSDMSCLPAQILMSRMCRTLVPTLPANLEPKVVNVIPMLQKMQHKVEAA